MKRTLSIAACATAMLAAAKLVALPIDNRLNPDGTPVLIPAVQQYQTRKGTLALPEEFTFTAPADADSDGLDDDWELSMGLDPARTTRLVYLDAVSGDDMNCIH